MTMDEETAAAEERDATAADETPPVVKKRIGRVLASLSLLVGLAALGAAGYLYYELVYMKPIGALSERVVSLEAALPALKGDLGELGQAQTDGLEVLAAAQRDSLAEAQQAMISALNEVSNQAPPSPREWKLAEVEYLLRIANHRLLMERDVDAALNLLRAADEILLELDDFGLYQVRAALADELLALGSVRGNDVQGIYLRLEAIKGRLMELPLDLPEYLSRSAEPETEQALSFWEALRAELSGYLALRRFDGSTKPLLAPEEAVYLELNLRLMLERSQLAALRRQQVVYEQSIATARDWLGEYLDPDNLEVAQVVGELESLLEIQLDQQLPDVSGSLTALLQASRGAR
jgi:uroporphyrin-3 C-methyltransferase